MQHAPFPTHHMFSSEFLLHFRKTEQNGKKNMISRSTFWKLAYVRSLKNGRNCHLTKQKASFHAFLRIWTYGSSATLHQVCSFDDIISHPWLLFLCWECQAKQDVKVAIFLHVNEHLIIWTYKHIHALIRVCIYLCLCCYLHTISTVRHKRDYHYAGQLCMGVCQQNSSHVLAKDGRRTLESCKPISGCCTDWCNLRETLHSRWRFSIQDQRVWSWSTSVFGWHKNDSNKWHWIWGWPIHWLAILLKPCHWHCESSLAAVHW